jgi:hypothetical protein
MRLSPQETGQEVFDLRTDAALAAETLHARDAEAQLAGLQRLSHALLES